MCVCGEESLCGNCGKMNAPTDDMGDNELCWPVLAISEIWNLNSKLQEASTPAPGAVRDLILLISAAAAAASTINQRQSNDNCENYAIAKQQCRRQVAI